MLCLQEKKGWERSLALFSTLHYMPRFLTEEEYKEVNNIAGGEDADSQGNQYCVQYPAWLTDTARAAINDAWKVASEPGLVKNMAEKYNRNKVRMVGDAAESIFSKPNRRYAVVSVEEWAVKQS